MGRSEALQIASNLRRNPQYEQTLIIALASEDEAAPETLVNYGFNEAFKKPFDVALLGERIRTLVEEKRDEHVRRSVLRLTVHDPAAGQTLRELRDVWPFFCAVASGFVTICHDGCRAAAEWLAGAVRRQVSSAGRPWKESP